jgi:hypothetical protein
MYSGNRTGERGNDSFYLKSLQTRMLILVPSIAILDQNANNGG